VRVTLEELISRWKGRRANFELMPSDDESHLRSYHGILDGPYLGDDGGVGFMLGSRVIQGDIAVEGPLIDFSPALPDAETAPILAESYVELRVVGLPLVADVRGHEASWTALLADQHTVRCRLVAEPDNPQDG